MKNYPVCNELKTRNSSLHVAVINAGAFPKIDLKDHLCLWNFIIQQKRPIDQLLLCDLIDRNKTSFCSLWDFFTNLIEAKYLVQWLM